MPSHSFNGPLPTFAHTSSPDIEMMPDVVVHPPEDDLEERAPWVAFAGTESQDALNPEAVSTTESRLAQWQHSVSTNAAVSFSSGPSSTSTRRGSVHQSRPFSASDEDPFALEGHKRPGDEMDDIIEVVKIPRGNNITDITQGRSPLPKKSGLKARATLALRNIRGRSGGASKASAPSTSAAPVKENTAPLVSPPQTLHISSTEPALHRSKSGRRLSRPLSQFFSLNAATAASITSPDLANTSTTSGSQNSVISSSTLTSTTLSTLQPSESLHSPSSTSTKSARRRFSFVNLQSMFVAPQPSTAAMDPFTSPRPTSPADTNETAPSAETEIDAPSTPVDEEDFSLPSIPSFSNDNGGTRQAKRSMNYDEDMLDASREISFEMRLDSLHFEQLSFDADEFDISR